MARSDAPDTSVDELRRKARRRLVGAIVLALAAAVLLPLLLENEPKPLGDDVSIQIPPVDTGKFVNPLSPAPAPDSKGKIDKTPESAPAAQPTAPSAAESVRTESKGEPAKTEPAKTDVSKTEPAKAEPPAPSASAPGAMPAAPSAAPASRASESENAAPQSKSGPYVVQVAAFADRYGARTLVAKLKKDGFPGYTETISTDKGTLHRVRVGPYASREVADAARAKLKAAGFSGVVARSG
jgi:DedD protein